MKPTVFIHTNHKQWVGALVGQHALRRNSANSDKFDVRIIAHKDYAFFQKREGQSFLRDGGTRVWHNDDLQSFTPLRFMPPELMGYQGRAVVIDPDVFAVGDVWELLSRDMKGKAIMCRPRTGNKGFEGNLASSVMLLDCAKLTHWKCEEQFDELFDFKRDYMDWISLKCEPKETIGLFENHWNDFDKLTAETRMLHNTKRQTQPWKAGLPIDYTKASKKFKISKPWTWLRPFQTGGLLGAGLPKVYSQHPDPKQEAFFFGLVRECLENGSITEELLREEMAKNHVRHDAFEVVEQLARKAA